MNRLRKCGIYTQWNFTQPQRIMKFCHPKVNGWNWRTSFQVKLARLRMSKTVCSHSHADYRPKTKAAMFWSMHHTKGKLCKRGIEQWKETKNLNEVDVLTVQE
jgi:hypothetical protein